MENAPAEAPAEAPKAPESEATPTTNQEPAKAPEMPDMHGFTSEQLAEMKKFYDANGGFEKVKSKISNPSPAPAPEAQPQQQPTSQPQVKEPEFKAPAGSITAQEFLAQQYFQAISREEKYAPISKGIESGEYLKEMSAFGINPMNPDGSINDQKVRMYLDLKAQTVPAQATHTEPNAAAAPTVEYVPVEDGKVTSADQAYKILQQDSQLKAMGQAGHPAIQAAEEFIKNQLNPGQKTAEKK